jgi:myo-inositol-1(or 4)-monophosphatase
MTAVSPSPAATSADADLLPHVVKAVHAAGDRLRELYDTKARPDSRAAMYQAGLAIEAESRAILQAALDGVRPGARWAGDEEEDSGAPLPPGEWWVADGAEGGVNFVHGLPEWAVSTMLIRDNEPVLAAVYQPVPGLTWTAVRGGGAQLNGEPLTASAKTSLDAAIATMSQANGGPEQNRRTAASIEAMLGRVLLVRNTIPTTFPLLAIAAGHYDLFWQYQPDLPGVAAGSLLVTEAGGTATDLRGEPWRPGAPDVLIAASGLHTAALDVLAPPAATASPAAATSPAATTPVAS